MVHEAAPTIKVDHQVKVAARDRIATGDRAKHPHIACTMTTRQREYLISALSKMVERQSRHLLHPITRLRRPERWRNCPTTSAGGRDVEPE